MVVTEKLDGENTTIYGDGTTHARSLDSGAHPSRTTVRALAARLAPHLEDGLRICGENLHARHSIAYDDLLARFYGFSIWRGDRCLAWDDTVERLHALGIPTPRVLYRGPFDRRLLRGLKVETGRQEGYVVRRTVAFDRGAFGEAIAKWVRPQHVTTSAHWMHQAVVPNGLAPEATLWAIRNGQRVVPGELERLFPGGTPLDIDLPAIGEGRLALVLAGWLRDRPRGELLPWLAHRLPALARPVADLLGLAPFLARPLDDEKRVGGLVSLGRAVDLDALHRLADALHPDASEAVTWSRMVAEDAGLLDDPRHHAWVSALLHDLPELGEDRRHKVVASALDARSRGKVVHPQEAVAYVHPLLTGSLPVLTLLVGPSGSGKSTYATAHPDRRIALDALRERDVDQPLSVALATLDDHLRGGGRALWDATSLTPSQRVLPRDRARRHGALVRMVSILTPRAEAERRNRTRKRTVPPAIVERQWHRIRWPYAYEADVLLDHPS